MSSLRSLKPSGIATEVIQRIGQDTADQRLAVAARLYAQEKAQGGNVVLQAGNARMRDQLTTRTREALTEARQLGAVLGEVTARVPVWLDATNRNDRSLYRAGMVLEHNQRNDLPEIFTITGVSERLNLLTVQDEKGQTQGLNIGHIDSQWRLFREKKLQLRDGEQLRTTSLINPKAPRNEKLRVAGYKPGNWLFKDKFVMENTKGEILHLNGNAPLYVDYDYAESFGATRRSAGSVIAVLAGKDVTDATINMLRRSGDRVVAFSPLDENAINRRLAQNRASVTVTQSLKAFSGLESLTDAIRSVEEKKMSHAERAVRLTIEKITGTGVTFSGLNVLAAVITDERNLTIERTQQELQRLTARGEIISLTSEQGAAGSFISRENFENEVTILRHITEGRKSVPPFSASGLRQEDATGLTTGQQKAARLILTSRDRITTIQGYVGVGKTTQFRTVAAALGQLTHPPEMTGLAPTHRAVSELSHAGIPVQIIASFLSENGQQQADGQSQDYRNRLFVIDESSMNGNAQLASLLTVITEGGGRAVLSGDRNQLKSMESGVPFALALDRSAADRAVMREIVRQTPALRPVVEAMIAGNVSEALRVAAETRPDVVSRQAGAFIPAFSTVNGKSLHNTAEGDPPDLIGMIADDYAGRTAQARGDTLIVAELNADRTTINDAIHQRLQENGTLSDSVTLPVLSRVNNSQADLGRRAFWQEQTGNIVRVGEAYFRVSAPDAESGVIRMEGLEGIPDRWFRPAELRRENVAVFEPAERDFSVGEKVRLTATDRERNLRASDMATVINDKAAGTLRRRRRVSLDPFFVFLRKAAGRTRRFRRERAALIDAIFPLLFQRTDLATWIVTANVGQLAEDMSPKDENGDVIPETRVEPSRLSRLFQEFTRFGITEMPALEWDPVEKYWLPRHIRVTDLFWKLCGVNMDKLLAQRNARLASEAVGCSEPGTGDSVREARERWYDNARIATLRQRRERALRGKQKKHLARLPLDERRYAMAAWIIRTYPAHELFNMDSDSFNRLVWQNLNRLELGLRYEPILPEPFH
ncbi:plasmid replication initiator RepA [Erwiniaceae bacterium L1_54_6]|nr:plasmid replication initiator RepA [Erwiniaceae bacterium L1_54_6]